MQAVKQKKIDICRQLISHQNQDWTNLRELPLGGVSNAAPYVRFGMLGNCECNSGEAGGSAGAGDGVGDVDGAVVEVCRSFRCLLPAR